MPADADLIQNLLSKDELKKLGKDAIVEYAFKAQGLGLAIGKLQGKVDELSHRLNATESALAASHKANEDLLNNNREIRTRLVDCERQGLNNAQYLRRFQLEINTSKGTLANGPDLKNEVATLLSTTGTPVTAEQLDKCHTIGKDAKKIIVELSNRTTRDEILLTRKSLKNKSDPKHGSLFISESLADGYRKLDFLCRKLKKNNTIHSTWFFNGRLWLKPSPDSDKIPVAHIHDLYKQFSPDVINPLLQVQRQ